MENESELESNPKAGNPAVAIAALVFWVLGALSLTVCGILSPKAETLLSAAGPYFAIALILGFFSRRNRLGGIVFIASSSIVALILIFLLAATLWLISRP